MLRLNNLVADGIVDQLGKGGQIQFMHDVCTMGLNGLHTDVQGRGYLFIAFPLSEKLRDLALPRCELIVGFYIRAAMQETLHCQT